MRSKLSLPVAIVLLLALLVSGDALAGRRVKVFGKDNASSDKPAAMAKPGNSKMKSFAEMTKDKVVIEGLFTFYHDTTDNSMLMAITPEQFGPVYLCNETRSQSEGAYYDAGSMSRSFPFYFERVGEQVMFMEKNVRFRADTTSALYRAIPNSISNHLFASTKVASLPDDSTKAILVDPGSFFVRDAQNIGYFLGARAKTGITFDKKHSYFDEIKSFPHNSEISVRLHYRTSRPVRANSMQNPYSMFHTYHYSLSTLPETDYVARIADDRVGYFLTLYQDYSKLDTSTAYVRYINRWNLKKKNPEARMSEPVEPIVYWIENTVPEEYRDAVAEGIEFWNVAFEELGFRNAVVAKQMPDTADWDPADVRYSTVRWIINPGNAYAVGPSRANPFTGQIYDADIRLCADWIRYMYGTMENLIEPVSADGSIPETENPLPDGFFDQYHFCEYGSECAKEAAFGWAYLNTLAGDLVDKDSLTAEYVHSYLVEIVAHEVGHTLGLRHNFKASTAYTLEQINDRSFTTRNGTVASIMDYAPPNIAGPDQPQGEFYASVPGPYDLWAIEYGYRDLGSTTPEEELPALKKIADRAGESLLTYSTDEDLFGGSPKSVDPLCNMFDMGDDPIAYCEHKISLTKHLWKNALEKFEKPGERYQKILSVFGAGWRSYIESARFAPRFVGGLHHYRHHVGDPNGKVPFEPVSAADQRRAIKFLSDNIFAADAFEFPADLLNRLQPERFPDFQFSVYSVSQVDYPIHARVLSIQRYALSMLYSPYILGRLINNQLRYEDGADRYTMADMFTDVRRSIWSEIVGPENINSFRRQQQLVHLNLIASIYLGSAAIYPVDARSLAANDLEVIETAVKKNVDSAALDNITRAHFKEVLRQIEAAKGARRTFLGASF